MLKCNKKQNPILLPYLGLLPHSENGLTSYENPNYHMDPQHIERNSHLYEEILSELHNQQNHKSGGPAQQPNNRKDYAQLGIESMGVDLKENFG